MSDYIAEIQSVFLKLHSCDATYVETVPVVEEFQGETIWQGDVEAFDLSGHPKATRGYGWGYTTTDEGGRRYFTVLELPPRRFTTNGSQDCHSIGDQECERKRQK